MDTDTVMITVINMTIEKVAVVTTTAKNTTNTNMEKVAVATTMITVINMNMFTTICVIILMIHMLRRLSQTENVSHMTDAKRNRLVKEILRKFSNTNVHLKMKRVSLRSGQKKKLLSESYYLQQWYAFSSCVVRSLEDISQTHLLS